MKAATWAIAAFAFFAAQISAAAAATCPVTAPVKAAAPPDQSADPISGYWHISTDRLLWAPAAAPGTAETDVGRYWVRPAGMALEFSARRLDAHAPPVVGRERSGYPTGFYFGSINIPTEGCWEVTAAAGFSTVTFVAEIRYSLDRFARESATRVTWSREIGKIEEGAIRLVITAVTLEDPQSVTRRTRGVRIDLTDGVASTQLWQDYTKPVGTSVPIPTAVFERWAEGALPMLFSLGGYYAVGNASGLSIACGEHQGEHRYLFQGHQRPAELARLLMRAIDALNAPEP